MYEGDEHPTDALVNILDGIYREICNGQIRLKNPSNSAEWITDRWDENNGAYHAFVDAVLDFRVQSHKLLSNGRFPRLVGDLKSLFGDFPVSQAMKCFGEGRRAAREEDRLFMETRSGKLIVKSSPAAMAGAMKLKDHTFYGEE